MLHRHWDLYDTRHAVFLPHKMSTGDLERGYWRAYRIFYRWSSILEAAARKATMKARLRHIAYSAGWKKLESFWDLLIRFGQVSRMLPLLEAVLNGADEDRPTPAATSTPIPDHRDQALRATER